MFNQLTKKWILLLVFVLSRQVIFAQTEVEKTEIQSFSLNEALTYAVENSYSTKSSQIEVAVAEEVVKETIAIGLPQISASAEYQNMLDIPVNLVPAEFFGGPPGTFAEMQFGTQHNANFGITLSQLIFSGEYIVGVQATNVYKDISVKQNKKTEKEVKESVTKSYYLALVSEKNVQIIDSTLKNLNKLIDETQEIYKQGLVDDITVDQLVLTKRNIEMSKQTLDQMIEISYRLLKFQMGIEYDKEIRLSDKLDDFINVESINALTLEQFNVESHIDYEIADLNVIVNQNLLKKEKSTYLPQLSGFLTYSKNGMNNNFGDLFSSDWYPTSIVGLQLNVPIFNSGSKYRKVNQAKLKLKQAEVIKEQAAQGLYTEVIQKRSDLKTALTKFDYEKENMLMAKKIYDKTLTKFKQGMASNIDLTQVQNQYLTAQSSYFSAIIEMLNKKTELESLLSK